MNYNKIGNCIKEVNSRNTDRSILAAMGVNIKKNFMPTVANLSEVDISKYKIVKKNQFATNIMHVDRDEILPIALHTEADPIIVSPAYKTFEVIDENELLPEFIMMQFNRPEFDRKAWTFCDSSVRGGLEWERFCDIDILVPEIDLQKKFVDLYNSIIANQSNLKKSLKDIQLIFNTLLEDLKKYKNKKEIGNLIKLVDNRNQKKSIKRLLGININKKFIKSKANISDTDISKYKVIENNQFAFNPMQVGRDEVIRVAHYTYLDKAIISPAYQIFEVIDNTEVLPEYLMIWFSRGEFDRYGWFISDGSVRASLEWEIFTTIKVPLPDIEIQKTIVSFYNSFRNRNEISEKIFSYLKPISPILIKGVLENTNGK